MEFGLFSNGERGNAIARTTYDEDLAEVVHADALGMSEAWISEHGTLLSWEKPDTLPSADLFICKAAALTKNIRMGPGIRPLPFFHPVQVATDVAVCDHLTGGRYLAGFGLGIGTGNGQRGELPGDRRVMMAEAIDLILKCWTEPEPFDWNGQIWQGKNWHIVPKPLTRPRPEVGIACSRTEGTLEMAAAKGFLPLMSWNPATEQIAQMLSIYMGGRNDGGDNNAGPPRRGRARVARVVYVAESDKQAYADMAEVDLGVPRATGRLDHYIPEGGTRDDLSMVGLMKSGDFFGGSPDTVYEGLKNFYDAVGGFGTLLIVAGRNWGTWEQRKRSWTLFMEEVAPRLARLDPDK
jgi:alkanesulfonate monooxygenase SsuD/methylene tetrahydromethanopterin reductase-like flavin-dependent oxidoreductase (luciferase family)